MSKTNVTLNDVLYAIQHLGEKLNNMEKRLSDKLDMFEVRLSKKLDECSKREEIDLDD